MKAYEIRCKALQELRTLTKENPSGTFARKKTKYLWLYIKKYCRVDEHQTHFRLKITGEVYEVDIIGNSLAIYKHNWKQILS